ncbi:MAG: DUF721 domain-containing protein [Nitrospiraceae bacterium]
MSSPGFDSFSSILEAVAQRLGLSSKLVEQRIALDWVEIVGEQIAAHTRPEAIRNRRLSVLVDHSVWMQQLSFLKPDLLRLIRVHTGDETVQDLGFRIGDLSKVPLPVKPAVAASSVLPDFEPSPQLLREAEPMTSRITDPDLRARFTKAIAKALVSAPSTPVTDRSPSL